MTEPVKTFNENRAQRAMSERRFELGPYTFTRMASVAPESIMGFQSQVSAADGDDRVALGAMEQTILALVEPSAIVTATGEAIPTAHAWSKMRTDGDEYGPLALGDLAGLVQWLIEGVVERPTGLPSDSPDGSASPPTGTTSMGDSPSPVRALTISTPDGVSTRSTQA